MRTISSVMTRLVLLRPACGAAEVKLPRDPSPAQPFSGPIMVLNHAVTREPKNGSPATTLSPLHLSTTVRLGAALRNAINAASITIDHGTEFMSKAIDEW